MSCEEEVLRLRKKLEKVISGSKSDDSAMGYLAALKDLPMTLEILQKTRIGMTMNEFRKKTKSDKLSSSAKGLIKGWKKLLDKQKNGADVGLPRTDSMASNLSEGNSQDPMLSSQGTDSSSGITMPRKRTQFPPMKSDSDEVREKCRNMLLNSLSSGEMPDGTLDAEDLAEKIEEKLLEIHKMTSDKYKAAIRSRVFNLRDKKNPALRENILTGVVLPERFAVMTSEEMASAEMKDMRTKFTKEAINEHQMSVQTGTPTDMFKCGKCRKKNCTYTQIQTRSADEPMTTFVYCRECGNRWKFC